MYNTKAIMTVYNNNKEDGVIYRAKATNGNHKLGKAIFNINLPPVLTCNPKAPCFKECYGRKGHFLFTAVQNSMMRNLFAFCQDSKQFFDDIAYQTKLSLYVRWFGNGDMPNEEFLAGMCRVARKNPNVRYLAFTKQYHIVNDYIAAGHKIPRNLRIVFSCWKDWIPENPYNFPTTWVRFPESGKAKAENISYNSNIPAKAFKCPSNCAECQACWHLKKGGSVEFHKH